MSNAGISQGTDEGATRKNPSPFGRRFMDASLSKSQLSRDNLKIINDWIKSESKFLVFVGNPGIGKTYHCAAVYNWIRQTKPLDFIRYFSEAHLLNRLRGVINEGWSYAEEIKTLVDDKWILIDDIGSTNFTEWRKEVFFQLINYRYDMNLPTMLTSNLRAEEFLEVMHPRVHSRIFSRDNYILNTDECIDFRRFGLDEPRH